MGVIERQTIKSTIYSYIGVALGFVTTGLLFPRILLTEQIGLLSILIAYSVIFSQFGSLGFNSVTTRLFTYFRDHEKNHHGFLFIALIVAVVGLILTVVIFLFVEPILVEKSLEKSPLFTDYSFYIIPLIFFTLFYAILDTYYKVLYNVTIGIFLKELLQRLLIFASVLLFYFKMIEFSEFVFFYVCSMAVPTIVILFSLIRIKQFNLKPELGYIDRNLAKTMVSVGLFGIIASGTGIITLNIDRIMVDNFLGLGPTGIYTTAFFFGTLVIIPARSLTKISSAFIADAWKNLDLDILNTIYFKSAINQFIVGLLILIGLWVNIDNIFIILPESFSSGKYVILLIGLAYLFDMILGVNAAIIANSKYYRMQAAFMLVMVVLIIISNIIFIPRYGIVGAAFASALSKLIVNILRVIFLAVKYKMMPYNYKFILVLVIGISAYLAGYFIPVINNYIIDILVRSFITSLVFGVFILLSKASVDMNQWFLKILGILRNYSQS